MINYAFRLSFFGGLYGGILFLKALKWAKRPKNPHFRGVKTQLLTGR